MKRKSLKKSILACTLSLVLAVGSAPVMSLAEDVAVTDGQDFVSEEEQNPEANTSFGETRIYNPEYDFDANLITLPGKNEEDHWEISAGDVEPLDTFTDAAQGMPEDKDQDAIELDPDSVLDEDITVSGNDTSDNEGTAMFSSGSTEDIEVVQKETALDTEESMEVSSDEENATASDEFTAEFTDGQDESIEEGEVFSEGETESSEQVPAAEEEGDVFSGQDDENSPQYQLENGVLTVSGTGRIDNNLYKNNTDITELVIKNGITSVGDYSFYECTSLTRVILPDTLTEIGSHAFAKCTALTEIDLNEGLSTIEDRGFEDCTALKRVFIPISVEDGLVSYTYNPSSNKAWGIFNNCRELTTVEFAEGTTRIHSGLFGGSGLKEITFPESVTEIGMYAFANCESLEEINFSDSMKRIEERAFSNCTSVKKLDFPENINYIGAHSFDSDGALTEISIPLNWQNVDIYYEYNSGDHNAWGIFNGCSSLKTVNFAEGTTYIHGGMFAGSGLTEINLPDTVATVGDYAFSNCRSLNSFITGSSLQSIGENTLANCTSLKDLEFLDQLTSIGEGAFYGCTGFTELDLPETLSEIGTEAFGNCTSLKKVILPITVMDGSSYYYSYYTGGSCAAQGIFNGCSNLEEVIFPENSTRIPGGLLAGSGIENITIPNTITSIGPYAFSNTEITSITIPESVTDIGFCAFSACSKLKELTVPAGWETCSEFRSESGPYAQGNIVRACPVLETVILPEGMKKIPDYAFF